MEQNGKEFKTKRLLIVTHFSSYGFETAQRFCCPRAKPFFLGRKKKRLKSKFPTKDDAKCSAFTPARPKNRLAAQHKVEVSVKSF
jgi:hypothetical protein